MVARELLVFSFGFMEHHRLSLGRESVQMSANIDWLGQSEQSGIVHNFTDTLSRGYFAVTQRPKLLPVLTVRFSFT